MKLFALEDPRPIHFMGIGGAGMSALALMAKRRGVAVTGCDIDPGGAADVARAGAEIRSGHDPSHVEGARAVVYTAAVPEDHPELVAARRVGVPLVRRADALQAAIADGTVVAVAGTHGKTTTTAMTAQALTGAGADPTALVGGRVAEWDGNARLDGDTLFVVEADEYDKAFLSLRPTVAVVNNVEADHLDCYGTVAALEAAFVEFAGRAERLLAGSDDGGALRVAEVVGAQLPVWRVGLRADADIVVTGVVADAETTRAAVALPDRDPVSLELAVPGLHNVRNAAMALGVVAALDRPVEPAAAALATFRGVARRFEVVGRARGITIVDDYAHHPTEVAATLAAARGRFPGARVVAVFQPHLYSRTAQHGEALGVALSLADVVVVTEIYAAREAPLAGVSGRSVLRAAERAGADVRWVPEMGNLVPRLEQLAESGDVVLTLGAGDVTNVGRDLLRRLRGQAA